MVAWATPDHPSSWPGFLKAMEVLDLKTTVHLTGSQGAWQLWPFASISHPEVISGTIVFLCLLLGSLQQECFTIRFHILPASPFFFWLRPEGVAGEWGCPAWEELLMVLATLRGQLFPSEALLPVPRVLLVSQVSRVLPELLVSWVLLVFGFCCCHTCCGCCSCRWCRLWRGRPQGLDLGWWPALASGQGGAVVGLVVFSCESWVVSCLEWSPTGIARPVGGWMPQGLDAGVLSCWGS